MKPLLIFGLRGTLIERIFSRDVTNAMPPHHLMVGLHKVWIRPRMLQTLYALQPHCRLAIWSSTTARNTVTVMDAIFNNKTLLQQHLGSTYDGNDPVAGTNDGSSRTATAATQESRRTSIDSRGGAFSALEGMKDGATSKDGWAIAGSAPPHASTSAADAGEWTSPFRFEFVWTREHTTPDDFRRLHVQESSDEYATVKDLGRVFTCFSDISRPYNTVLIDDTPSKAKKHADNFLWLDSCEGLLIQQDRGECMDKLHDWVMKEVLPASDVRTLLPVRICMNDQSAVAQQSSHRIEPTQQRQHMHTT